MQVVEEALSGGPGGSTANIQREDVAGLVTFEEEGMTMNSLPSAQNRVLSLNPLGPGLGLGCPNLFGDTIARSFSPTAGGRAASPGIVSHGGGAFLDTIGLGRSSHSSLASWLSSSPTGRAASPGIVSRGGLVGVLPASVCPSALGEGGALEVSGVGCCWGCGCQCREVGGGSRVVVGDQLGGCASRCEPP